MSRIQTIIQEYEGLKNEVSVLQQKLSSKCDALMILSKDLDKCRQEKDQFKLMAEQVQSRYQALKRQLAGIEPISATFEHNDYGSSESLMHVLSELRDVNKGLQLQVDDYKQKLMDAQGDIKLLREQIVRQRVGTTDEGMNTRHFPAQEKEMLVKQLEQAQQQHTQLERDLEQVLDQKEEYETERDAYRSKYERLNQEMNYILKGDEKRVLDVDALITENRYLQERVKQMEEENNAAMATVSKYKNMLGKKKNKGIMKVTQNKAGGVVISQKQVRQLLDPNVAPSVQMVRDLQSLSIALLETVNDKNLVLSHQRNTNKILGSRISELEKKLKNLEVSGVLNTAGEDNADNLSRMKLECDDIRSSLLPITTTNNTDATTTASATLDTTASIAAGGSNDCVAMLAGDTSAGLHTAGRTQPTSGDGSDVCTSVSASPHHTTLSHRSTSGGTLAHNAGLSLEGLDIMPTKDISHADQAQHRTKFILDEVTSPLSDDSCVVEEDTPSTPLSPSSPEATTANLLSSPHQHCNDTPTLHHPSSPTNHPHPHHQSSSTALPSVDDLLCVDAAGETSSSSRVPASFTIGEMTIED